MTAGVPEAAKREPQPRSVGFPRSARLLRHADFERVYKLGRRHFSASLTAFYLPRPETPADKKAMSGKATAGRMTGAAPGVRIGFTVSRALGGAVQRNRMKRRLREAVRLCGVPASATPDVVGVDVVINPKKSLLTIDFADVVNEVKRAFVVIEQRLAGKVGIAAEKKISGSRKPEA